MYQVFNMGHRMELYVPETVASEIIKISHSFNVKAQIIGRVEPFEAKKLTISSNIGVYTYRQK
jgi:phosphoribosylformylglycinamidine cyclo-ligase